MTRTRTLRGYCMLSVAIAAILAGICFADTTPDAQKLSQLLERTSKQTAQFLEQFSDVKCTEQVRQEKVGNDEKVQLKEDSTYDYLVILSNEGGELNIAESRIPVHEAKKDRKKKYRRFSKQMHANRFVRSQTSRLVMVCLSFPQRPPVHLTRRRQSPRIWPLEKSPAAAKRQGWQDLSLSRDQNVSLPPICQFRGSCCAVAFPNVLVRFARLLSKPVRFTRLKTLKNSNRS